MHKVDLSAVPCNCGLHVDLKFDAQRLLGCSLTHPDTYFICSRVELPSSGSPADSIADPILLDYYSMEMQQSFGRGRLTMMYILAGHTTQFIFSFLLHAPKIHIRSPDICIHVTNGHVEDQRIQSCISGPSLPHSLPDGKATSRLIT